VKAAGTRARKALAEFTKIAKERRKEIQDSKTTETKS
jgi:vacuolar-type H+-ATPase subunit H